MRFTVDTDLLAAAQRVRVSRAPLYWIASSKLK